MRAAFAAAACAYWQVYSDALGAVDWRAALEPRVARHTLGCLLARVAGRPPLDYLAWGARAPPRAAAIELMRRPPATVAALVEQFVARLGLYRDGMVFIVGTRYIASLR
jgi:hypothetical protein